MLAQDRILYARDYFDNKHQEFLNGLGLPQAALSKIYSGNALKLVSTLTIQNRYKKQENHAGRRPVGTPAATFEKRL